MNFDLSDEQLLLQETVEQFLATACPPNRIREIYEAESACDPALWEGMAKMGLAGIHLPEDFGGAGLEILDLAVVAETLGRAATPGPFFNHAVASQAIALAGSDEQKRRWLPALATGDRIATFAFAEDGGVWDPADWRLEAGEQLSGEKRLVPFASHADLLVIGLAGGAMAVVEGDAAGLETEAFDGVDRTRRLESLRFRDTPCETLPGAAEAAARVRDLGLVLLSADAFGGASRLVEMCVDYAKTREQFGVTIGHFQGLKHQLANMAVEVEPMRGLYWYAAHAFDHFPDDLEHTAAVAKAHICDRFLQTARDAVEAHGGIGFTWECDVQIWFKRALFDRAFLGNPAVHRERAARLAGW